MSARSSFAFPFVLAAAIAVAGCSRDGSVHNALAPTGQPSPALDLAQAKVAPTFDPGNFVSEVTHPFFPLPPGTIWSYVAETDEGTETNPVEVTRTEKTILGVDVTVVLDRVYLEGELKEETFDWYAQDKDGNVWYFGEDTKEYENGVVVTTAGSWEAGKNGAKPGIIMLANPKIGDTYHQEDAPGVVEDMGKVMSLKETVTVPYDSFENCLKTADWTHLEPGNRSFKYYARGTGLVLEVARRGGGERLELISIERH